MLVWVDISGAGRRKGTVDDKGPGRDGVQREDDENVREVVVDVRVPKLGPGVVKDTGDPTAVGASEVRDARDEDTLAELSTWPPVNVDVTKALVSVAIVLLVHFLPVGLECDMPHVEQCLLYSRGGMKL